MPKVKRKNIPPALLAHLLDRIQTREISAAALGALAAWLDTNPEAPADQWYKRIADMIVCGEGELVRTFLTKKQTPIGTEL